MDHQVLGSAVFVGVCAFLLCLSLAAAGCLVVVAWDRLRDPRKPKPPLGWAPWERPTVLRRTRYVVLNRVWRVRTAAHNALVRLGVKKSW